ncbi:5118_t:CDS:2, partial [Cetraspora pellucida]
NPSALIKLLQEHEKKHSPEFYQQLRKKDKENLSELEIAARFIYLNKAGYNGLYRVNSQGEFNVPFGKKEKVKLFDKKNLLTISQYLNNNQVEIHNKNYQELLPLIKKDDFLFVDPPYDSDDGNGFTSYTAKKFTRENQQELLNFLKECEEKGAKFINSQGSKRVGAAQEIFVGNYPLTAEQEKELEFENIEYWEDLTLEKEVSAKQKVKKLIFNSGLAEYLTNGQIKDLKEYCLGVEVGLGTHRKKNISGKAMEKAIEKLLVKHQMEYQKQIPIDFEVKGGKKTFDFQISLNGKEYYLETSFYNVSGSKPSEVARAYEGVLQKAKNNEINFL